jgi:hypothetical protein
MKCSGFKGSLELVKQALTTANNERNQMKFIKTIWKKRFNWLKGDGQKVEKAQRKVVLAFAEKMVEKLELRSETKGRPSLLGNDQKTSSWFYFKRLDQEVKELRRALNTYDQRQNSKNAEALISECCDVANFAAAIAENTKNEIV